MIEFKDISKSFAGKEGPIKAIDKVRLTINEREIFGIIGESGAGKSTLLRFINALDVPDSGIVTVDGVDVFNLNKSELRKFKKNIGMIFQQFNLLSNKTVEENILLPLELHNYENHLELDQVLDFVDLADKKYSYPNELSGGQKQRVGIARGLITRPKILLCDEPTSALDENTKREIISLLAKASEEFNITILVVTHELDVVKRLCDRVGILEKGKLVDILDVNKENPYLNVDISYKDLAREVLLDDK